MNDQRLGELAGMWLRDIDSAPTDPRASVRQAMEQVRETRQVRRWWPPPRFRRMTLTPATADTVEYETTPITATNGRSPTVIGRTTSMLSPVKAIAAGAIVFAIGGVMLIAQPFQQQSSVPGATAPEPPVAVSGSVAAGGCPVPDIIEFGDGLTTYRDGTCNPSWSLDDPRLEGTVTWAMNNDIYRDESRLAVGVLGVSIVNEDGAWRMVPETMYSTTGTTDLPSPLPTQFVMVGEGAYEGYYAVFTFHDARNLDGFIVQGEPPPVPQTPSGS